MASKNAIQKLAATLLRPQDIAMAEELANAHFDKAVIAKDKARIRELTDVLSLIDDVKTQQGKTAKPATPPAEKKTGAQG